MGSPVGGASGPSLIGSLGRSKGGFFTGSIGRSLCEVGVLGIMLVRWGWIGSGLRLRISPLSLTGSIGRSLFGGTDGSVDSGSRLVTAIIGRFLSFVGVGPFSMSMISRGLVPFGGTDCCSCFFSGYIVISKRGRGASALTASARRFVLAVGGRAHEEYLGGQPYHRW